MDNTNRGNAGSHIEFTFFGDQRSKTVNDMVISTKSAQAAHAAPHGSCTVHWRIIPHYLLGYPLADLESYSKIIQAVMNGWEDDSGSGEGNSGFIHSLANLFAMKGQAHVVDFYSSTLALPAIPCNKLLSAKVTDEIDWVVIFADGESAVQAGACGEDQALAPSCAPSV